MPSKASRFRYRLGIDVGVASLGIAVLALEDTDSSETNGPNQHIVGGAIRTYPLPEGASERRDKRAMRRNINRIRHLLGSLPLQNYQLHELKLYPSFPYQME